MPSETTQRLNEISAELAALLEARIQELASAMKAAESATRQIVSTEMEIARYRQSHVNLSGEIVSLEREMEAVRTHANEIGEQVGTLTTERDRLRSEVARREREVREADAEIQKLQARSRGLEEEGDTLRQENQDLRGKTQTLQENVTRMKKLKEELMLSISGLTQQMGNLHLGNKE